MVVAAAPDEDLPFLRAGEGVVFTTRYGADGVGAQRGDRGGERDDGVGVAGVGGDACLSEVVCSPGVDGAGVGDGEGVIGAGCDEGYGRESDAGGCQGADARAGGDAAGELALFCCAPGEDLACGGEGEDVVVPCGEGDDFGEGRDEKGGALEFQLVGLGLGAFEGGGGGEA